MTNETDDIAREITSERWLGETLRVKKRRRKKIRQHWSLHGWINTWIRGLYLLGDSLMWCPFSLCLRNSLTSPVPFGLVTRWTEGICLFHEQFFWEEDSLLSSEDLSPCSFIPGRRRVSGFHFLCCIDVFVSVLNACDSCIAYGGNWVPYS